MKNSIILGGGCFWCLEAAFQKLPGITKVTSGYAGGSQTNPDYHEVCGGKTGHAEVVLVEWDLQQTDLQSILDIFFLVHDATTLNRQGNDIGTQYRSFIGYQDQEQLDVVTNMIDQQQSLCSGSIVTELQESPAFYPAEIEHQNYYNQHTNQPYCQVIIRPKLQKVSAYQDDKGSQEAEV